MRAFRRIVLLPLFLFALGLFAQYARAQGVGFIGSGYGVSAPTDVVVADFNDDGKLDLATASCETQDLSIVLDNGDGTLGAVTSFAIGPCNLSFLVEIVAGDFNGDSKLDLATANGHTVSILLGQGGGVFATHLDFPTGIRPTMNNGCRR